MIKDFINSLTLVDLPLERRKFTWYRSNGQCGSSLDRFLLTNSWMTEWPNLAQFGLKRKVSDHTAILLKEDVKDWGPKPFKFLNSWVREAGFKEMVEKEWASFHVEGWSGMSLRRS